MMKLLIKFIFILFICCNFSFAAQSSNNDAIIAMEQNLVRLEEVLRDLTSKVEELGYQQKKVKEETANHIKDLNFSLKELKERNQKIEDDAEKYNNELKMLNDLTSSLKKDTSVIKKDIQELTDSLSSIATKEPVSLVDEKNQNKSANAVSEELLITNEKKEEPVKSNANESKDFEDAQSFYKNNNFTEAAIKYADFIKKYPESKNFYLALLHLGISMKELEKVNSACQAFANIINSKENIDSNIKSSANKEFEKIGCKNLNGTK